jgi:hypothetical protein
MQKDQIEVTITLNPNTSRRLMLNNQRSNYSGLLSLDEDQLVPLIGELKKAKLWLEAAPRYGVAPELGGD